MSVFFKIFIALIVLSFYSSLPSLAQERFFIQDPLLLYQIEQNKRSFSTLMGSKGATNAQFSATSTLYRSILNTVKADIHKLSIQMEANGRKLLTQTGKNIGRVFDEAWLTSPYASFRLVGVVFRPDKKENHALENMQTCGELRYIYRLGYKIERTASRLPFNFNAVYRLYSIGKCPQNITEATNSLMVFEQLELNAQIVRFPSGLEVGFGGQATYLLRVFDKNGQVKLLENTIDVEKLQKDAALKARLRDYINTNIEAIDKGVYKIPSEFLTTQALSWSTFGAQKQGNHPFQTVFKPDEFKLPLIKTKLIASSRGLLARLDNGTCMGCHQAGSTAGFHFIGLDMQDTFPLNRVEVGISPHFYAENKRKNSPLFNQPRALSFFPTTKMAAAGQTCLIENKDFKQNLTCENGYSCQALATNDKITLPLGQCVKTNRSTSAAGEACIQGAITTGKLPFLDVFQQKTALASFKEKGKDFPTNCLKPEQGTPGGMLHRNCSPSEERFENFINNKPSADICGLIGGKAFDICAASHDFESCLEKSVKRGNRQTCSQTQFCREDYMCQALPSSLPNKELVKGYGYCSPTYFLFQMRLDGHPDPRGKAFNLISKPF